MPMNRFARVTRYIDCAKHCASISKSRARESQWTRVLNFVQDVMNSYNHNLFLFQETEFIFNNDAFWNCYKHYKYFGENLFNIASF
jgi:hypothetical protein